MRALQLDELLQVAAGTNDLKIDYTFCVSGRKSFELIHDHMAKLENKEITIVEFYASAWPYMSYYNSESCTIRVHLTS